MTHFLAIALRSFLLLALVANGTLASVHAHGVKADSPEVETVAATNVMPCHEEMTTHVSHDTSVRKVDQHACCDADCVCDFVVSTAIATVAWMPVAVPAEAIAPIFSIGELLSPVTPRLLRPPIA